jgi:hypothetical protein
MVKNQHIIEWIKVGTGCLILLALTGYVIFSLKPSFDQILQFIPYIAMYLLGYISKSSGGNK